MENIFISIFNMSINAAWFAAAVIILRLILKNAPKNIRCILWALVGIRLVMPFSVKSIFSLIPNAQAIPPEALISPDPTEVMPILNELPSSAADSLTPEIGASVNPLQVLSFIAAVIWIIGLAVMLCSALISYIKVRRRVRVSLNVRDNIYLCDNIDSPFILGIFKPRIYIPSDTDVQQKPSIEAHERTHIKRRDHIWKPLGYALLSLHWFNPLVWVSYILFCRDIELACDEQVIKEMTTREKQEYSEALLSCSISRGGAAVCPLAFGEVGVKQRIKSILSYKKPALWIIIAAVILCGAAAVCFLTNPIGTQGNSGAFYIPEGKIIAADDELEAYLHNVILEHHKGQYLSGSFACEAHTTLEVRQNESEITAYMLVMYSEYSLKDGNIQHVSGSHIPTVITVDMDGSGYSLIEYWQSSDGTLYAPSIREKYAWYLADKAIRIHEYADIHSAACIAQAEEHFGVKYVDPYKDTTWTTTAVTVPSFMISLEEIVKLDYTEANAAVRGLERDVINAAWGKPYGVDEKNDYWVFEKSPDEVYTIIVHYRTENGSTVIKNINISQIVIHSDVNLDE